MAWRKLDKFPIEADPGQLLYSFVIVLRPNGLLSLLGLSGQDSYVVIGHVLAGILYSYWAYPVVDLSINMFTIPAPYKPVNAQTLLRTTLFRWSYPFKISLLGAFFLLTQLLSHITSDALNTIWVITPSLAALPTLNQRRASIYDDLHL